MKYFQEWYYAVVLAYRILIKKQNRSEWFKGIPLWYVEELGLEEPENYVDDDIKLAVRQAREESAKYKEPKL